MISLQRIRKKSLHEVWNHYGGCREKKKLKKSVCIVNLRYEMYEFITENKISLRKIQFRTSIYENITGEMKSSVSVMNLITAVIKKFITECVNSFQLKGPISGC